jgi:hypothetical protein
VCFVVFLILFVFFFWFLGLQHAFFHFVQFQHCFQSLVTMFDKEFTLKPIIVIINGPRPLGIDSTTTKGRNVVMVPWGAQEGKGQNNVANMVFVLVFSRQVGTKSCWNQWVVEDVIYIAKGQVPTQIQMPMLWKLWGSKLKLN